MSNVAQYWCGTNTRDCLALHFLPIRRVPFGYVGASKGEATTATSPTAKYTHYTQPSRPTLGEYTAMSSNNRVVLFRPARIVRGSSLLRIYHSG